MTDNPNFHRIENLNFDGVTGDPAAPQPPPTGDGAIILHLVLRDLEKRAEMGRKKYGTYLRAHNGRDVLVDIYQEQLDAAMYIRQLIYERDGK